jgi:6-phosphogluconolactonase
MAYYAYIALSGDHKIAIYTMDPDTGGLQFQQDVPVSGAVGPLAVDSTQRFLYAGIRSPWEISTFRIDPHTGSLVLLGTIPLEADPCFLALDRTDHFVLSAYYRAGGVAVHAIGADGTVRSTPVQWLATAANAHAIQTDASNRFAFVPHIAGPNLIMQFLFDAQTGRLTPNPIPTVEPPERVGPRHFCFHPSKDLVYFVNEQGCSVTAYHFNSAAGTLEAFQTVSTLPQDFTGENTCAQIRMTPSGKFLYASNRGHNSIACFAIDSASGALTVIGQQPTEPMPRAFNLDPEGKFLFASSLGSGQLIAYRINSQTGALTPLATYPVGKQPMWVLVLRLSG